ncbi:restriction endonuclease subunit S [Desulfonema ishimotonii]|uniref:Restriction endonuclease subunit S n=1 Tax=Desulfonema ishimotonii TaxID=45657 RepID=A0A401FV22_9BACT|nr:restriction endonuclease subunit S [Desulfonema ishimotonii]
MIFIKIADMMELIDGDRGRNYPKKNEYLKNGHCLFLYSSDFGFSWHEKCLNIIRLFFKNRR